MKRVLFLCTGNSIRSLMAEALLRHHGGKAFQVTSAGTEPQGVDPRTLELLDKQHIPLEGLHSKAIDTLTDQRFDFVISLCSQAHQECQNWPGAGVVLAWDFPDPKTSLDPQAFMKVLHAIENRIQAFIEINRPAGKQVAVALSPAEFFKALADELRLKTLLLIQTKGELCVCELMAALQESQPKISRHLAQLRKAGLLLDRRQKQWIYYRLHPLMHNWMGEVLQSTYAGNPAMLDAELFRLQQVMEQPSETLSA